MHNAWLTSACLIAMAVSLSIVAAAVVVTAVEAGRTLRRVREVLPEVRATAASARRLLGRAHRIVGMCESTLSTTAGVVTGLVNRVTSLGRETQRWFNGTGRGRRG